MPQKKGVVGGWGLGVGGEVLRVSCEVVFLFFVSTETLFLSKKQNRTLWCVLTIPLFPSLPLSTFFVAKFQYFQYLVRGFFYSNISIQ